MESRLKRGIFNKVQEPDPFFYFKDADLDEQLWFKFFFSLVFNSKTSPLLKRFPFKLWVIICVFLFGFSQQIIQQAGQVWFPDCV